MGLPPRGHMELLLLIQLSCSNSATGSFLWLAYDGQEELCTNTTAAFLNR